MLGTLGDVIHDVVVRLGGPIQRATDTPSMIVHRRGGSAANVAVVAAHRAGRARFIGQLGADESARWLEASLEAAGVECVGHVGGRTGTVVSLVDETAERSMLTDRGSAEQLSNPQPHWLDGLAALHVPMYSLGGGPLAATSRQLLAWAATRRVTVSLDASSTALLAGMGLVAARALIDEVDPAVLFANEDEAELLLADGWTPRQVLVVKQGREPAVVTWAGRSFEVPVPEREAVLDTTGAGDGFAAGYLVAMIEGADPVAASEAGHSAAAWAIDRASESLTGI